MRTWRRLCFNWWVCSSCCCNNNLPQPCSFCTKHKPDTSRQTALVNVRYISSGGIRTHILFDCFWLWQSSSWKITGMLSSGLMIFLWISGSRTKKMHQRGRLKQRTRAQNPDQCSLMCFNHPHQWSSTSQRNKTDQAQSVQKPVPLSSQLNVSCQEQQPPSESTVKLFSVFALESK